MKKVGRPATGRKERISINIDPANLLWLKEQDLSYSKIINRLLHESIISKGI